MRTVQSRRSHGFEVTIKGVTTTGASAITIEEYDGLTFIEGVEQELWTLKGLLDQDAWAGELHNDVRFQYLSIPEAAEYIDTIHITFYDDEEGKLYDILFD